MSSVTRTPPIRRHAKTHCTNGHLFDEVTTYVRPNGKWMCRICPKERRAANLHPKPPLAVRFWRQVRKTNGCWLWTGSLNNHGYGKAPDSSYAHRWAFIQLCGPIPAGHEIDHLCRTTNCVRPDHLEAVTHKENMARSILVHGKNGQWQRRA